DIVKTFEDSETAKRAGRKQFGEMLKFIESNKKVTAILVEKTDRLYRNFKDYGIIDDLMNERSLTVYLVKEREILNKNSTSQQKFIHGIKTLMAKNFIDNLSEETKKGLQEKLERGEYPGLAPLGYVNCLNPETKHNTVMQNPNTKDLVVRVFELYTSGNYSLEAITERVEKEGLTAKLPANKKLYKSSIDRMLRNPFYYGDFYRKGKLYHGNHEPLISFDTWKQAQDILAGRGYKPAPKPYNTLPFPFKNIFTCGECGRQITAERKKGKYDYYRCTKFERECKQKPVSGTVIENAFREQLAIFDYPDEMIDYVTEGLRRSLHDKRAYEDNRRDNLTAEKTKLCRRLDTMYEDKLDGSIGEERYNGLFNRYSERLVEIDSELSKYSKAEIDYYEFGRHILELARNAKNLYELGTDAEKRQLAADLLSNSILKDGKPEFTLKQPFSLIAKRAPFGTRSTWGGQRESNPY
ncbi:MAG: recombinase family protein, partial [Patescibacteria group bacterium]